MPHSKCKNLCIVCSEVNGKGHVFAIQVVKRKYQQEYDIAPSISFSGDRISLGIPDDGVKSDNGWAIVPVQKAYVSLHDPVII